MKNITIISGEELAGLLEWLSSVDLSRRSYKLRVCVDDDAVKFKVNEECWSPPYGQLERGI